MPWFDSRMLAVLAPATLLLACARTTSTAPAPAEQTVLKSSTPASGATVRGAVDQLELRFSPPVRLVEVTVTGADGMQTPMMVTAVGEVPAYSLPLPGLEAGSYTVGWRGTAAGLAHQGSFRFTVR